MTELLLDVDTLSADYGQAQALSEVSLTIGKGEVVTLVGRNGAGKTTLLRSIMGWHKQVRGHVSLAGQSLDGISADKRARPEDVKQSETRLVTRSV